MCVWHSRAVFLLCCGLKHADAAKEMVNYYTDMVGRDPEEVNPDNISALEAGLKYY